MSASVRFSNPGKLEELIPARQHVLDRLWATGESAAWHVPFTAYWRLTYRMALRAGCPEAEAREVAVLTVLSLSRHRLDFDSERPKGFLKEWVKLTTQEAIASCWCRREAMESRTQSEPEPWILARTVWEEEWGRNVLELAVERVKGQVNPADFQIFDLHVLRKWPMARVRAALNMNIGRIYLVRYRLIAAVKREIRTLAKRYG
jgi:hypothetical protein